MTVLFWNTTGGRLSQRIVPGDSRLKAERAKQGRPPRPEFPPCRGLGIIGAILFIAALVLISCSGPGIETMDFDPATTLWFDHPAEKWEDALPIGNGRLGAMVYGRIDEERIQFNEETYWSGGPYDQTGKGGAAHLAELRDLIFKQEFRKAHFLFGRFFMGYPIEQQKYQSFGHLVLRPSESGEAEGYRHQLDLDSAIVTTSYRRGGVGYKREVFVTPVDQLIVVRWTADIPGGIGFTAALRGNRNQAHSNYATDYFRMDGVEPDGLILSGRSADYLGIPGRIRYHARLKAFTEGGRVKLAERNLVVEGADSVTLYLAAATNFEDYRNVGGDPRRRVDAVLEALDDRSYEDIKRDHIQAHREFFRRVSFQLEVTRNSLLPTDQRRAIYFPADDPSLAALCFQYGRYILICSSRPGTQPANLQGIWNEDMNPSWDSKYTTNINTEMNYWPAEVGNLGECAEPLFGMIRELAVQGRSVAREHYGCGGWVFHQNTDLWRAAAPMDGAQWGTFTTGGAWLCTHIWEHYLFTGDREFLSEHYPVLKGSAEFFLDFLVEHPESGYLVTCPSTSPENYPGRSDNLDRFFDEVTGWMSPGDTICAGSTIDLQILADLFEAVAAASEIEGESPEFRIRLRKAMERLAPMRIGRNGDLQEWLEDWPQKEAGHRHISHLYGLFPGHRISMDATPDLAAGARAVLEQRGLPGNGWSSAWKMGCWARLAEPQKALNNFHFYIRHYTTDSLFALCSGSLQVDGLLGVTAALAEMLVQSNGGGLRLIPALPDVWSSGSVSGLKARGGFELDMEWTQGRLRKAVIRSGMDQNILVRYKAKRYELRAEAGGRYVLDGDLNRIREEKTRNQGK